MKKTILTLAAAALMALTACQTPDKLAKQIEGSWTSIPEKITVKGSYQADIQKTYEFLPTQGADGQVIISAMISVEKTVQPDGDIVEPISLSTAATATMTGTYTADSYNKVTIKPEPATLTINVDPKAVTFDYSYLSGAEKPELAGITPVLAEEISGELQQPVRQNFTATTELTDIRIHGDQLTAKSADTHIDLHRQGQ